MKSKAEKEVNKNSFTVHKNSLSTILHQHSCIFAVDLLVIF